MGEPLNNCKPDVYHKDHHTPDLLRNLAPDSDAQYTKNYNKDRICDTTKPQNIPTGPVGRVVSVEDTNDSKTTRRRKVKRGLCFVAWVLFCPCMLVGLSRREPPDTRDSEDIRDDPCLPCYYDPYFNPSSPQPATQA